MVRLKEKQYYLYSRQDLFQFLMVRLKDFRVVGIIGSPSPFQFLMVRLKVLMSGIPIWRNWISIPYGAIKRVYEHELEEDGSGFQFLMVRLKE